MKNKGTNNSKTMTLVLISMIGLTTILFCSLQSLASEPPKTKETTALKNENSEQVLTLKVGDNGFEPKKIDVKPNLDVSLKVTRTTDSTCAKQIQIPSQKIKVELPLNKEVTIKLGKLKKGEIRFGCGMEMMDGGTLNVQ